ncbi:MAG: DNA polymerase III subunit delta' [Vicinamibacterales bacterium]
MPFRSILGHRHLTALLMRAVERGSVPATLLFAGPAGVGKWRVARALAEAVNCQAPAGGDACGECRSCGRIARDVHVDVLALVPDETGKIKVDVVRDALERCAFRPFEGLRRVVLVREADALMEQAQNALLKSLEEPPPATMFVLTSAAPDSLLRTVRSRTMRLTFGRLPAEDVERILVRDHEVPAAEAHRLAMLADGSVGAALALGSDSLAGTREAATDLLRAAGAPDMAGRLAIAKAVVGEKSREKSRQEVEAVLRVAASIVRDVSVLHAGSDRRLLANGDIADVLERLARLLPAPRARTAFATLDRGVAALERNAGTKLVVEWVAAEL